MGAAKALVYAHIDESPKGVAGVLDAVRCAQVTQMLHNELAALGRSLVLFRSASPERAKPLGRHGRLGTRHAARVGDDLDRRSPAAAVVARRALMLPTRVFSTKPSSRCMSELQSFITSSALRLLRKLMIPAGRSMRAQTVPDTTSLQRISSVCCWVRSSNDVSRGSVILV